MLSKSKEDILETSNLGDSGFMLCQMGDISLDIIFKSQEQCHSFNFPYQAGYGGDDPIKAINQEFNIKLGNIIVFATDG